MSRVIENPRCQYYLTFGQLADLLGLPEAQVVLTITADPVTRHVLVHCSGDVGRAEFTQDGVKPPIDALPATRAE